MKNNRLDLGKENVNKLFFIFVIPAVLNMLASTTAGLIDSYFVGNFIGAVGIGAITLVAPISNICFGIAAMIVLGGVVLAGISAGKDDWERSNNLFNVTFFLVLGSSFLMMLMIWLFGQFMVVDLMGITGEPVGYILDYLMVINLFIPFFMLVFFFSVFLKLDGFPIIIVWVTVAGVFINVIMNYFLIYVFSFGMVGAALATGMSQMIPCLVFFWITVKKSNWKFAMPKFYLGDIAKIFFNGSSELLNLGSVGIAGYIYNLTITKSLGTDGMAAYGIAMQVSGIATMVFYGVADGVQSLVSFNYGAGKFDRVDKIRRLSFKYSGIIGFSFALMFIVWGKEISGFFVKNEVIKGLSGEILVFYGMASVLAGINLSASTYYTALGQPVKSAMIAFMRSFFGLLVGLFVFPMMFKTYGVWIPIVFTEVVTIFMVIYYIKVAPYGAKRLTKS